MSRHKRVEVIGIENEKDCDEKRSHLHCDEMLNVLGHSKLIMPVAEVFVMV